MIFRARIFTVVCAGAALMAPALAQTPAGPPVAPGSAVVAVVNDTPITTHDLDQRTRLMIMSSGGAISREMIPLVQRRALQELVEEQLKFAEGEKYKVKVSEADIDEEFTQLALSVGVQPQDLLRELAAYGVEQKGFRNQIHATILWQRIVSGRFRDRVRINPEEIEATLERMREDATNEQFLVSEICIPIENPSQTDELYRGSLNLIDQMRRGVPFAVVAQQFSACTSAAAGGDLGWVRAGELAPEIDTVLKTLPPGSVTNPISSEGALLIMAVRDKRAAVVAGEHTLTIAYAGAPVSMGRATAAKAFEKLPASEACAAGTVLRQDLGPGVGVVLLENVKMDAIDERFHFAIDGVGRGELGPIVEADDAFHVAYVCERDEGLGLPSREALESRAFSRQLARIAQQYLRDLERKATVDVRIGGEQAGPSSGR